MGFDPLMRYVRPPLSSLSLSLADLLSPLQDTETSNGIRRYLALRTCTPNFRKAQKDEEPAPKPSKVNPVVVKEGKEIAGFILAEYEVRLPFPSLNSSSKRRLSFLPLSRARSSSSVTFSSQS